MNTIITFTLTQLVGLVLAICAAIANFNSQNRLSRLEYDRLVSIN